jgi:hypothetical protein
MVERIVTLQKMPAWDYSKPFEERGELFERGERVILVDGVRWGRTYVRSMGPRGTSTTFKQESGETVGQELRPGKFIDIYVDSTSERHAKQFIGGSYRLPDNFKSTEELVLEKARELVAAGKLRDPVIVKAEREARNTAAEKRHREAQERENQRFRERAAACVVDISWEDMAARYSIKAETSDELQARHKALVADLETETIDKIVAAMRWAQER